MLEARDHQETDDFRDELIDQNKVMNHVNKTIFCRHKCEANEAKMCSR